MVDLCNSFNSMVSIACSQNTCTANVKNNDGAHMYVECTGNYCDSVGVHCGSRRCIDT